MSATYEDLFKFFQSNLSRLNDNISVEIDDEFFEVEIYEYENTDILDKGHVVLKIIK